MIPVRTILVFVENNGGYCCAKWVESRTFKHHVQINCNSHTTTVCANPISPGSMLASSKTANYNWHCMRAKSELQKALHAPTRNR